MFNKKDDYKNLFFVTETTNVEEVNRMLGNESKYNHIEHRLLHVYHTSRFTDAAEPHSYDTVYVMGSFDWIPDEDDKQQE